MRYAHIAGVFLLVAASGGLMACDSDSSAKSAKTEPYVTELIEGTQLKRLTLTEKAVERLDIQVSPVSGNSIPYAAVLYGLNGETFVYTNPEPLTYVRADITVDRVEDNRAHLTDGPDAGTPVVTVGAAELYGIDAGIGK
jgi:hypothetical protein